jgi:hypothetical protein
MLPWLLLLWLLVLPWLPLARHVWSHQCASARVNVINVLVRIVCEQALNIRSVPKPATLAAGPATFIIVQMIAANVDVIPVTPAI